ncbi:MAG: DUF3489 domain-containing protein [Alphaproteobacteria bacterium]|nr:DUF3489 domain-containing protein [Alphaproteobacteria bacterium]
MPTKQSFLTELLTQEHGHTVASLSELLGWQAHTTRAALTRLRQTGTTIEKLPPAEGQRAARYRIGKG